MEYLIVLNLADCTWGHYRAEEFEILFDLFVLILEPVLQLLLKSLLLLNLLLLLLDLDQQILNSDFFLLLFLRCWRSLLRGNLPSVRGLRSQRHLSVSIINYN